METCIIIGCAGGCLEYRFSFDAGTDDWLLEKRECYPDGENSPWKEFRRFTAPALGLSFLGAEFGWFKALPYPPSVS